MASVTFFTHRLENVLVYTLKAQRLKVLPVKGGLAGPGAATEQDNFCPVQWFELFCCRIWCTAVLLDDVCMWIKVSYKLGRRLLEEEFFGCVKSYADI